MHNGAIVGFSFELVLLTIRMDIKGLIASLHDYDTISVYILFKSNTRYSELPGLDWHVHNKKFNNFNIENEIHYSGHTHEYNLFCVIGEIASIYALFSLNAVIHFKEPLLA